MIRYHSLRILQINYSGIFDLGVRLSDSRVTQKIKYFYKVKLTDFSKKT